MSSWLEIFLLTFFTGFSIVLGALIAMTGNISSSWFQTEFRHTVIAFGGGILISAVSLVLVPEGVEHLSSLSVAVFFGMGGVVFMLIDIILIRCKKNVSQVSAMILDFIPEVTALGALYMIDKNYSFLLALLIVLQNIPEGFNAYQEFKENLKYKNVKIIVYFFAISLLGPLFGLIGYFFLSESFHVVAAVMLFSSGGILYLIFQDIAPQVRLKYHFGPSLGAVAGFLFGLIGKLLIT